MVYLLCILALQACFFVNGAEKAFDCLALHDSQGVCVSSQKMEEHCAIVQFYSNGELYQVRWNTTCLMYNDATSIEAVLERNLLNGCGGKPFFVSDSELCQLLNASRFGLIHYLRLNDRVDFPVYCCKPLTLLKAKEMVALDEGKVWEVLKSGCGFSKFVEGEVRILFPKGGFSGVPSSARDVGELSQVVHALSEVGVDHVLPCSWQNARNSLDPSSQRYAQMKKEQTDDFQQELRLRLQEKKLCFLEKMTLWKEKNVVVRYMPEEGQERALIWDVSAVVDRAHQSLMQFLLGCVILGTSLGYIEESEERHFAFINLSINQMLACTLCAALEEGEKVRAFQGREMLLQRDVIFLPDLVWTVVPQGGLQRTLCPGACSISFVGLTLEGLPCLNERYFADAIPPRSLAWGFDFDPHERTQDGETLQELEERVKFQKVRWSVESFVGY